MAYTKTEVGQRTFKERSVPLTPRQRAAFILFDGRRSVADVLSATGGLGVTPDDIDYMVKMGLLEGTPGATAGNVAAAGAASRPAPLDALSRNSAPAPLGTLPISAGEAQARYQKAYLIATQITSGMGLRGFRLNLAVEGAGSYEQLLAVAPKIREAVGPEKYKPLGDALKG